MERRKYYSDGVTKRTDPFYVCSCPNGHQYWSVTYQRTCNICKEKIECVPANIKKENPE